MLLPFGIATLCVRPVYIRLALSLIKLWETWQWPFNRPMDSLDEASRSSFRARASYLEFRVDTTLASSRIVARESKASFNVTISSIENCLKALESRDSWPFVVGWTNNKLRRFFVIMIIGGGDGGGYSNLIEDGFDPPEETICCYCCFQQHLHLARRALFSGINFDFYKLIAVRKQLPAVK